jgi:hypothetical protein
MTRFSMSVKQNAALTGLIVVLIFVSGCKQRFVDEPGPGKKHGQEDKRSFRIYIYADPTSTTGGCLVDWPQAILWKTKHQTAIWISDDGAKYTVDFSLGANNGPFTGGPTFAVPANGDTGDLTPTSQPGYYSYGIRDANGNKCKDASNPDPGVYVK